MDVVTTRGLVPHPGSRIPPQPAQGQVVWVLYASEAQLRAETQQWRAFTDGSCTTPICRDLARAGWAIAFYGAEDHLLKLVVYGPVWS